MTSSTLSYSFFLPLLPPLSRHHLLTKQRITAVDGLSCLSFGQTALTKTVTSSFQSLDICGEKNSIDSRSVMMNVIFGRVQIGNALFAGSLLIVLANAVLFFR